MRQMEKPGSEDILRHIMLPLLLLTVTLAGGLRISVSNELLFLPPQLAALILGLFAMILFVRGGILDLRQHLNGGLAITDNVSGAIFLFSLYTATVQVFNLVTPERGLLNFCFNSFYFLIFLNNLFVIFNPARLAKSLSVVLGASFALKYLILADLFAPSENWAKYALQKLMQTASLGAMDYAAFGPATGYLAFAAVVLYLLALYVVAPRADGTEELLYELFKRQYRLSPAERRRLLAAVAAAVPRGNTRVHGDAFDD